MSFLIKYRYTLGYIICVAVASVTREIIMGDISPVPLLFISIMIATCYFHLINWRSIFGVYVKFANNKLNFVLLNLLVAIMWVSTYYSIYLSSATIFIFEYFTVMGFCAVLTQYQSAIHKLFLGIFTIIIVLPFMIYNDKVIGVLLAIIAGICGFIYNVFTKNVTAALEINASQTLASRFWLLIIILYFYLPDNTIELLSTHNIFIILYNTILTFILQIWFNQQSIIKIGGRLTSRVTSFTPVVTFLVQGILLEKWFIPILLLSLFSPLYIMFNGLTTRKIMANN